MSEKLFSSFSLGPIELKNRIVMAPMTRSRATNNIPNELMAEYYRQRSDAGLIITEGTAPHPNGCGYARIPGAWSDAQAEGWKLITKAVHDNNGRIFLQIMHTGRVGHPDNMEPNAQVKGVSAIQLSGEMYTDTKGPQPYPTPIEMTESDILEAQESYVTAAKNAIKAGFDGVELHGANGYLIEQFINTQSNKRTDQYGGNIENRSRFVLETAKKVVAAVGKNKVGIRISPYGVFNDMEIYDELDATYEYLTKALNKIGLVYIHVVDHSAMGAPEVPETIKSIIKTNFDGAFILSGGYNKERATQDLEAGKGDLVAFGRPFIPNPDLVTRMKENHELATPDHTTFYTPGPKGYTDYPALTEQTK